ncbi:hypothetical protein ECGD1_034 [Enterobacteria phage ECGD1]|nr:hypothetical protein ECGD1_034 [Enterobacteria phage ECGD1]
MQLNIGQPIFDEDTGQYAVIVARMSGDDLIVSELLGSDPQLRVVCDLYLRDESDRIALKEDGMLYYTWTRDPGVTEVEV